MLKRKEIPQGDPLRKSILKCPGNNRSKEDPILHRISMLYQRLGITVPFVPSSYRALHSTAAHLIFVEIFDMLFIMDFCIDFSFLKYYIEIFFVFVFVFVSFPPPILLPDASASLTWSCSYGPLQKVCQPLARSRGNEHSCLSTKK